MRDHLGCVYVAAPHLLVIDNYDSFVYNLVQYVGELGATVEVVRNDKIDATEVARSSVRRCFSLARTRSSACGRQLSRDYSLLRPTSRADAGYLSWPSSAGRSLRR